MSKSCALALLFAIFCTIFEAPIGAATPAGEMENAQKESLRREFNNLEPKLEELLGKFKLRRAQDQKQFAVQCEQYANKYEQLKKSAVAQIAQEWMAQAERSTKSTAHPGDLFKYDENRNYKAMLHKCPAWEEDAVSIKSVKAFFQGKLEEKYKNIREKALKTENEAVNQLVEQIDRNERTIQIADDLRQDLGYFVRSSNEEALEDCEDRLEMGADDCEDFEQKFPKLSTEEAHLVELVRKAQEICKRAKQLEMHSKTEIIWPRFEGSFPPNSKVFLSGSNGFPHFVH